MLQQVVHIVTTAFNWLDFAHEVRQLPAHGGGVSLHTRCTPVGASLPAGTAATPRLL